MVVVMIAIFALHYQYVFCAMSNVSHISRGEGGGVMGVSDPHKTPRLVNQIRFIMHLAYVFVC